MRASAIVGLAALLAAAVRAQEPDPSLFAPPTTDPTPTVFACTVGTLAAGRDCVFEGQSRVVVDEVRQARENAMAAAALGNKLCARAAKLASQARADPDVLAACQRSFVERAAGCAADGSAPLLDAEGRFGAGARACYDAMSEVLAKARFMAAATGSCCRCLAAAGCVRSGEPCNRGLSRGERIPAPACAARQCPEACQTFLQHEPVPPPELAPAPAALPPLDRSGEPRHL